jgi:hypothetical protein
MDRIYVIYFWEALQYARAEHLPYCWVEGKVEVRP